MEMSWWLEQAEETTVTIPTTRPVRYVARKMNRKGSQVPRTLANIAKL